MVQDVGKCLRSRDCQGSDVSVVKLLRPQVSVALSKSVRTHLSYCSEDEDEVKCSYLLLFLWRPRYSEVILILRYDRRLNMTGVTVVLLSLILTATTAQTRETLFGCEGETLQLRWTFLSLLNLHDFYSQTSLTTFTHYVHILSISASQALY